MGVINVLENHHDVDEKGVHVGPSQSMNYRYIWDFSLKNTVAGYKMTHVLATKQSKSLGKLCDQARF